jgi:DNA-binding transcriptional MocR family regulator
VSQQLVLGKFNTVISCSPLDEALALRLLASSAGLMSQRRRHLAEALSATAHWVEANGELVDWVAPEAGAICCLRLKPGVFDEPAIGRFYAALAGEGLRVAKGSWFGEEDRIFRLGFGLLPIAELRAGLAGLGRALREAARRAA